HGAVRHSHGRFASVRFVRILLFTGVFVLASAAPVLAADSVAQTSCADASACASSSDGAAPTGWGVKMNLTAAKQWPKVVLVWVVMATPVYLSARRRLLPGQS